jgi:hypothetical protein
MAKKLLVPGDLFSTKTAAQRHAYRMRMFVRPQQRRQLETGATRPSYPMRNMPGKFGGKAARAAQADAGLVPEKVGALGLITVKSHQSKSRRGTVFTVKEHHRVRRMKRRG